MNCFLIHSTGLPSVLLLSWFKALKELLNYLSEAPGLPYNLRAVVSKKICLLLYFFVCFVFFIVAFSVPKNMKT